MAIKTLQGMYRTVSIGSSPIYNAILLYIEEDATITDLTILSRADVTIGGGNAVFQVSLNGTPLFATTPSDDRPEIAIGDRMVTKTGLSIAVVKGDIITLDKITSAVVYSPLALQLTLRYEGQLFGATSATSNTIGTGTQTFAIQAGLSYQVGSRIRAARTSAPTTTWMEGVVTAYSGTTLTFTSDLTTGSGTHTDWTFSLAGERGAAGATGSTGATGSAGANGQGVPTGGTTGQVLEKIDGTDYNTQWATPSGGGGSLGIYTPDKAYASPNALDDEFNTGSLDGKWGSVVGTTPTLDWGLPNHLGLTGTDANNPGGYLQAVSAADITFAAKFIPPNNEGVQGHSVGLVVKNALGRHDTFHIVNSNGNNGGYIYWTSWTTLNNVGNQGNSIQQYRYDPQWTGAVYMKIQYVHSGTLLRCFVSPNGITWYRCFNSTTFGSSNITNIGIHVQGNTAHVGFIDWFRVLQGTSFGGNV